MVIRFYNCRLIKPESVDTGELWVDNGRFARKSENVDAEIDLEGMLVAPGYIDMQLNGAYGHDFTNDPTSIATVAERIPETGVTSFCPTVISSYEATYRKLVDLSSVCSNPTSAHVLGYHLEGPYINPDYCGAHDQSPILQAKNNEDLREVYVNVPSTVMVTLAPEIEGTHALIQDFVDKGIVVSIGHSESNEDCFEQSLQLGAKLVTHLFNAMGTFHHRNPGVIGAVLSKRECAYSLILDDWHLHPSAVQLAWNANPQGVILVTDAMAGLGLDEGDYVLAGKKINVTNGKAVVSETRTLAGSVASLDQCVRRFRKITSCSIPQAVATVTSKPASILGIYPQKGALHVGSDADFVVLDDDLMIRKTYIRGLECTPKR